jgi:Amt family ammonium transporter
VLGFCSGAVAGLVVVTPAYGFFTANGAVIIGLAAGLVPWFFCYKVKGWFGYDDALDTFGVHAVGGTMGAFLTGVLARHSANANLETARSSSCRSKRCFAFGRTNGAKRGSELS